ncbi:LysR family transcriptional regulator [Aestuariirhabdus sp. Z084]|uniref:LysR family transcriptional regulator n=1 Tax=Aestuariirhabdus haliotis TaxID=2918751 RepID=UPI00201B38DB|nr:LysR family transcriptional regulator [Aestuariirhabdus haliotis]MCL6416932.1 LysR family transcriptional regulator [Aestuariirhabdus haliotis]MCL6420906.1 LysR family transcriptional regulator [Aestuariirhabdus haliotis]
MNGINRLDIKQLRVLAALLQERNLSRVADNMGLTQQAISEQLRKLREVFEDRLFIRQGNGMVATPKAEQLGGKIHDILQAVESLLEQEQFDPASYQGILNISATDYAIQAVLPPLLKVVRQQAPHLKMVVRDFESENLNAQMAAGEIDLTLTFPPFLPDSLHYITLFEEQHTCVAPRHSELTHRQLTLEEVAALPQLIVSPARDSLRGSHDAWFAKQGLQRNILMSIPSFSAAPKVIAATDTIAFYPERLLPNEHVVPLKLDTLPPSFEVVVAWHPRSSQSPIHRWLIDELKALF